MGGLLLTSIISGRIISRTGNIACFDPRHPARRDRHGTADPHYHSLAAVAAVPVYRRAGSGSGAGDAGAGPAVQNAMPAQMYGVATSGVTLFRSIGGSIGGAVWRGVHARSAEQPATTAAGRRGAAAGNESGGGPAPARGYPPRLPRRLRRGDPRGVSDGGRHYGGGVCPLMAVKGAAEDRDALRPRRCAAVPDAAPVRQNR